MSALVALLVAAVATPVLAHLARGHGWIDRREGQEERKPRSAPVPPVGGAALLLATLAGTLAGGPALPWPALVAAFALGTLDDRLPGGLAPGTKLVGQLLVAALLAFLSPPVGRDPWGLFLLALVAMNAVNTWDHADGTAGGLAVAALGPTPAGAAALGFLPWNLARRRGDGVPHAYLGDAGSHLIGVTIAAVPGAAWVLLLPLADLLRLSIVRLQRGSLPWVGDRQHLAHRLQAAGARPVPIAVGLALLAAAPRWGDGWLGWPGAAAGAALTLTGFVLLLRRTPDPCPPATTSR